MEKSFSVATLSMGLVLHTVVVRNLLKIYKSFPFCSFGSVLARASPEASPCRSVWVCTSFRRTLGSLLWVVSSAAAHARALLEEGHWVLLPYICRHQTRGLWPLRPSANPHHHPALSPRGEKPPHRISPPCRNRHDARMR